MKLIGDLKFASTQFCGITFKPMRSLSKPSSWLQQDLFYKAECLRIITKALHMSFFESESDAND